MRSRRSIFHRDLIREKLGPSWPSTNNATISIVWLDQSYFKSKIESHPSVDTPWTSLHAPRHNVTVAKRTKTRNILTTLLAQFLK